MALTASVQFIPLQNGQRNFVASQQMINNLLGVVGYEVVGGYIEFTEDITGSVPFVDMQLMVMDLNHYSDYDILPLTADMAQDIVMEVAAALMQTPPPNKKNDIKEQPVQER